MKIIKLFLLACVSIFFFACEKESFKTEDEPTDKVSYLKFENEAEVFEVLSKINEKELSERNQIEKLQNFHSMFDEFEKLKEVQDEDGYKDFLLNNKSFLSVTEFTLNDKVNKHVRPKVTPAMATIVNINGEIMVGDKLYNVLKENEQQELTNKLITSYTDNGEVTNTNKWGGVTFTVPEVLTRLIPVDANLTIPGFYPTKYFDTTIKGRRTLVQLWKGYCPLVYGLDGGVGAEVGLYQRISGNPNAWMPDYKYMRNISYSLIRKSNGKSVLNRSGKTWWLNGWKKYIILPLTGKSYTLRYTIEGTTRTW